MSATEISLLGLPYGSGRSVVKAALALDILRRKILAAERARIKAEVQGLEGACHSHSGLNCDASPCVENVNREEVLAIVEEP